MGRRSAASCIPLLMVVSCGGGTKPDAQPAGQVLVEAGGGGEDEQRDPLPAFVQLMLRDQQRSIAVILESLKSDDPTLAAWAAVHASRFGIGHDLKVSKSSLVDGSRSSDPLLASLCWRWIASRDDLGEMSWPAGAHHDPVAEVFAAFSFERALASPEALGTALALPGELVGPIAEDGREQAKRRVVQLMALTAPFDGAALPLALAFLEARRNRWTELNPTGTPRWVAQRLRDELRVVLWGSRTPAVDPSHPASSDEEFPRSRLLHIIETPLVRHPASVLRALSLKAETALRIEALRALTVVSRSPVAGDMGAASAALKAKDPLVRLEGARTFLVLLERVEAGEN